MRTGVGGGGEEWMIENIEEEKECIIPVKRVKNLCTSYYTFTPINVNICLIVFVIYIQAFIYIL